MATQICVAEQLKFANLQMAAEALLKVPTEERYRGEALERGLIQGNNRVSRFTAAQAADFAANWEVVEQKPDTNTGFSGTLFRRLRDDPVTGAKAGELVLSFRSTEFIDDAARDNKATNELEIAKYGFALGQLRDMEAWVATLRAEGGPLYDKPFSVTGYSLGGHLASAFNLMHGGETLTNGQPRVERVVTFNGAGIGGIGPGTTLSSLLGDFDTLSRNADGQAFRFSNATLDAIYQRAHGLVKGSGEIDAVDRQELQRIAQATAESDASIDAQTKAQAQAVLDALARVDAIRAQAAWVPTLSSGSADSHSPTNVPAHEIEQASLDYQMAVAKVGERTDAAGLLQGLVQAYHGASPHASGVRANQFDIVGDAGPSAVANSQWHIGTAVPVFIEDQPLFRGVAPLQAAYNALRYLDLRLIGPNFTQNDFGDTHSLVLLVDSLSVQNAILQLLPPATRDSAAASLRDILNQASHLRASQLDFTQGKAEGDVLENAVNALADLLLGRTHQQLNGSPEGNTWASIPAPAGGNAVGAYTGRETFYALLAQIAQSPVYGAVQRGEITLSLNAAPQSLASLARTDFGAFVALHTLSPFALTGSSQALEVTLGLLWSDTYEQWQTDQFTSAGNAGIGALNFTDQWLADRAELLARRNWFNTQNLNPLDTAPQGNSEQGGSVGASPYTTDATYFHDIGSNYQIAQGFAPNGIPQAVQRFIFGGDAADDIQGGTMADHLYGGGGNDLISGGQGHDHIEGNAGADTLEGGAGNDALLGGQGADAYRFSGAFGRDVVVDSDGQGSIEVNGAPVAAPTRKLGEGVWQSADGSVTYTLTSSAVAGQQDLVIGFAGSDNRITVRDWTQTRSLGIDLSATLAVLPTTNSFAGEFVKDASFVDSSGVSHYLLDANLNYVSEGPAANSDDSIVGTAQSDHMEGGGGNDLLAAGGGDDWLEGGEGNDVLIGGGGSDRIEGGGGSDYIYSSRGMYLDAPSRETGGSLQLAANMLWHGFGWQVTGAGLDRALSGVSLTGDFVDGSNYIDAGAGDDFVEAGTAEDIVLGGAGADFLVGWLGSDVVSGGAGDDFVAGDGNTGGGIINGVFVATNFGDDAQKGRDVLDGGAGNDFVIGGAMADILYGGEGDDLLYGDSNGISDKADVSFHGEDWLDGGTGNDRLFGGGAGDEISGGEGADTIWGDAGGAASGSDGYFSESGHGNDRLDGGAGDDWIAGEGGNDELIGAAGNDNLHGDEIGLDGAFHGADRLDGGAGNDVLAGGGGSDTLAGGDGDDMLWGDDTASRLAAQWHGSDALDGGAGNDVLLGGGGADVLRGGDGDDWLAGGAAVAIDEADTLTGNDVLFGGAGNDTLVGSAGDDRLDGGEGADLLVGGAGDDVFLIGPAATVLVAGAPTLMVDTVQADQGRDRLVLDGVTLSEARVTQGVGGEVYLRGHGNGVSLAAGLTSSIGTVELSDGTTTLRRLVNDTLTTALSASSTRVSGTLLGGAMGDALTVRAQDTGTQVSAGRGDDTIELQTGGGAVLHMALGDGSDSLLISGETAGTPTVLALDEGFAPSDVRLVWRSNGWHTLALGSGDAVSFQLRDWVDPTQPPSTGWPVGEIRFADGTVNAIAEVIARGVYTLPDATSADDDVVLTPADDVFYAGSGNDSVDAGEGNDQLYGGPGNDTLIGGAGSDWLDGGSGTADLLIGGAGADTYHLEYGTARALDDASTDDMYYVSWISSTGGGKTFTIADVGGTDVLNAGVVTNPDEIVVRHTDQGITLQRGNYSNSNRVVLEGMIDSTGAVNAQGVIESVAFANGTAWSLQDLLTRSLLSTSGGDVLLGFSTDDVIDGGAGHDSIRGGAGADTLSGGSGRDALMGGDGDDTMNAGPDGGSMLGGRGDDTYQVSSGDGLVYVGGSLSSASEDQGFDTLVLGVNAAQIIVRLERNWLNSQQDVLMLDFLDGSATAALPLSGELGVDTGVESIRFADGSSTSFASLMTPYLTVGTNGADTLIGTSLDEFIDAGAGDDYVDAGSGNDRVLGGAGNDVLSGGGGENVLAGGLGNDIYEGLGDGQSRIEFARGDGADTVVSGQGGVLFAAGIAPTDIDARWVSRHDGSSHLDLLRVSIRGTSDSITFGRAVGYAWASNYRDNPLALRWITFADGTSWNANDIVTLANVGSEGSDILIDENEANLLSGGAGADTLDGLAGDDVLQGGSGDDLLDGSWGNDRLVGGAGNDTLSVGEGVNTIEYALGDGADVITRYWGPYRSSFELALGSGISSQSVVTERSLFTENYETTFAFSDGGSIRLQDVTLRTQLPTLVTFADGTTWTRDDVAQRLLVGGTAGDGLLGFRDTADDMSGGAGNDTIFGLAGSDTLRGGAGSDSLYAVGAMTGYWDGIGSGGDTDRLIGDEGDDHLYAGDGNVVYEFGPGFGHDTIEFSSDRNSSRTGAVVFASGIAPSDVVVHRAPGGALEFVVGDGTDTVLVVDFFSSRRPVTRVEFADQTTWTYEDIVARMFGAPTERADDLFGTTGSDLISALGGDDAVHADAGDDIVDGGAGDDLLWGGAGSDMIMGGAGRDALIGEDGNDILEGGLDNDRIYGGAGNDIIEGGLDNDEIYGDAGNDVLRGGDGNDLIVTGGGLDTVVGGAGDDTMYTTSDAETFDYAAGWGRDELNQLAGGDTIRFDPSILTSSLTLWRNAVSGSLEIEHRSSDSATVVVGFFSGGWSATGLRFTFADGNTWNLTDVQTRIGGIVGTDGNDTFSALATGGLMQGRAGNDVLTGSAAADTIDGGAGADRITGGGGDDVYIVDSTTDTVIEALNAGTDTVRSSVSLTLASNLEILELQGTSALTGTGNSLANTLRGNDGNNVLNGGAGADTMAGGAGDDTYVVDNGADSVGESAGEGVDLVQSSITWTLAANIEALTLMGTSAINGSGNALNNTMNGNGGANLLDGGAGEDAMAGGAGNDTYVIDSAGDVVIEAAGSGTDTVRSSVSITLYENVEKVTLTGTANLNATGNGLANTLTGNAGQNMLDGGLGSDTLAGGAGDDTYVVDSTGDVVTEGASAGADTVISNITLTLAANVENLTLTGTSAINGTGNALANILRGNGAANVLFGGTGNDAMIGGAGNDTLDGGLGNDTLQGGTGDDVYVVNVATDVVTEDASEGTDTVRSGVTWTLGSNVENLMLTGTALINANGNTVNNVLVGNNSVNTLSGNAGNDTLDGGGGNDTLIGGTGADIYAFGRGSGTDTVQENDTTAGVTDSVAFGVGILQSDTTFARVANNLEISILGVTDRLIVRDWYLGTRYQIETFQYADGSSRAANQISALVSSMAAFVAPDPVTSVTSAESRRWQVRDTAVDMV